MFCIHIFEVNQYFIADVEYFSRVKHCVLQRCPTEIQAPFNEDILTVYESSNRPLSKAKTHFPAQFQTFNNFPDHCTGNQSGMNTKFGLVPIFLYVHLILVFLACFWETSPKIALFGLLKEDFSYFWSWRCCNILCFDRKPRERTGVRGWFIGMGEEYIRTFVFLLFPG